MRVSGSGQSHDAAPLYWRGQPIPWPIAATLLILGLGGVFGIVLTAMLLTVLWLKHYPVETATVLVVSFFSIVLWARYRWR